MRSLGERLSLAGLGMIAITIAVFGWIGYELSKWPADPPQSTGASTAEDAVDEEIAGAEPSPTPTAPDRPQRFALLSDGLAVTEGSWFNRVVRNGSNDNVRTGAVASQAGLTASELAPRAEQAANADVLLVQGGTIDLLEFSPPDQVVSALQDLLRTAVDLGGPDGGPDVVWVTVPPLDAQPENVLTVNREVTRWAERNDITVWDLTTPVATPAGTWRPDLSAEGIAPTVAGQEAQAKAARRLVDQTLQDLAAG